MTGREFKTVEKRLAAIEQAILELAGTLRETRAALEGIGISLPSPSDVEARVSQSADQADILPA